jgi:hypothetical protein
MALADHRPALGAYEVRPAGRFASTFEVADLDAGPALVGSRAQVTGRRFPSAPILLTHSVLLTIHDSRCPIVRAAPLSASGRSG